MLDIDFFKTINDNYGHDMGDHVLINFADLIRQQLSPQETLFRWGGEEFAVLCRTYDLSQACVLGERLRKAVEASSICPLQRVTCSVGVAAWHGTDTNEAVFKRMDEALYAAKQNGRNRVVTENSPLLLATEASA
jgi:diguanylate cyclase (GGDEF)-like protein